jgi:putative endonuclease
MSGDQRREMGRRGERAAARYLELNGCRIVERNYRTREGEIDLIVISGTTLVFCEVKTLVARSGTGRGASGTGRGPSGTGRGPAYLLEGIGPAKRRQVRRIARSWLAERLGARQGLRFRNIRFDAIGVLLSPSGKPLRLERVEAAF